MGVVIRGVVSGKGLVSGGFGGVRGDYRHLA